MRTFRRRRERAGRHCIHLVDRQLNACRASGSEHPLGIVEPGGGAGGDQVIKAGDLRLILGDTDRMRRAVGQL